MDLADARYSLLRYFRLVEAREQLRYVLMRDRFVRVPLHPEKADRVPGPVHLQSVAQPTAATLGDRHPS